MDCATLVSESSFGLCQSAATLSAQAAEAIPAIVILKTARLDAVVIDFSKTVKLALWH
jgi:hypothetical protein